MSSGLGDVANLICVGAAANVAGGTGVAGTTRGGAVVRTGAGVYTFTMDAGQNLVANNTIIVATLLNTDNRIIRSVLTSATVVTVTTEDVAGAAADADFQVLIFRLL